MYEILSSHIMQEVSQTVSYLYAQDILNNEKVEITIEPSSTPCNSPETEFQITVKVDGKVVNSSRWLRTHWTNRRYNETG